LSRFLNELLKLALTKTSINYCTVPKAKRFTLTDAGLNRKQPNYTELN